MRLPEGCGLASGTIVRLARSLRTETGRVRVEQGVSTLTKNGFEQCPADARVFRLRENEDANVTLLAHADKFLVIVDDSRCDKLREVNKEFPTRHLGPLRWHMGCAFERDGDRERVTVSPTWFAH